MNAYFVGHLLGCFGAMSEDEISAAREKIDPNDPVAGKPLITAVLKPEFDRYDAKNQGVLRENLSYFRTVDITYWNQLYEAQCHRSIRRMVLAGSG
jgi:hypothetical protein